MTVVVEDGFRAASDPALPTLTLALDPELVKKQFAGRLKRLDPARRGLRLRTISVPKHKPGRRAVVKYVVEVKGEDQRWHEQSVFGKIRANRFGNAGYRRLNAFWKSGFSSPVADGIAVPQPLGTVPLFRMWFQRGVPGEPATVLLATPSGTSLATRIAAAIRKLHSLAPSPDTATSEYTIWDELCILGDCLRKVGIHRPEWRGELSVLFRECESLAVILDSYNETYSRGRCLIHRDFYSDQVIVSDHHLYLLDMDLCCLGDPALDVGNFIGHMWEQSIRDPERAVQLEAGAERLEQAYLALTGQENGFPVQCYALFTLVRHIFLSMQFPERSSSTAAILEMCRSRLELLLARVS